jgi:hypothetical protein
MTTAFTVLGMHKSGTTLVSQILHSSGIAMIEADDARSYDEGNHFERQVTNGLNKDLLRCGRASSLRVIEPYRPDARHADAIAKARVIAQGIAVEGAWGFKDPRSCLTHSFWAEALSDLKVICLYRSPSSVRRHYTARKPLSLDRGIRALRAWYIYNSAMLAAYEATDPTRRILLNYETLMQDVAELSRLENFVGRPLQDTRRLKLNRRGSQIGRREKIERAILKFAYDLDFNRLEASLAAAFDADRSSHRLTRS